MYIIYIMFLTLLFNFYICIYNYIPILVLLHIEFFFKYRISIKNISLKINILPLYIIFIDIIQKKY